MEMIRRINTQNQKVNVANVEDNPLKEDNNAAIAQLNETIDKLKKENVELRQKNEKIELELKTLKNEITKLKDPNTKSQEEQKMQLLTEELDKYKRMNKDRMTFLTEIQEKANEIMDLKLKLKACEEDLEISKKEYVVLKKKYNEEKAQNESLDVKMNGQIGRAHV